MRYLYTGPASGVTLADGTEVLLWPGKETVDLPEQHDYVQTLIALQYLHPLPEQQKNSLKKKEKSEEVTDGR
ncbi:MULTISPECIES: hypothetical protein [Xenorhabdus]|uniref:Uncharacterized protein n=2 Tax=Xenorhabdus TaxID=626 RepID=A0A2D0IRR1_9GAMM|nr:MULTISPECIES: hypothetical protein [Xenorhabdus]OKP07308.1 hypothetical protein Xentx_01585 [Xenorhabdus thuongxuanensis]PHM24585.1 hypothetical protein Xehl_01835 [Xenorhabdus ehlersii]RKE91224.1 hypothetical protein BDE27_1433 [Xenorhabdus ehlersii]